MKELKYECQRQGKNLENKFIVLQNHPDFRNISIINKSLID